MTTAPPRTQAYARLSTKWPKLIAFFVTCPRLTTLLPVTTRGVLFAERCMAWMHGRREMIHDEISVEELVIFPVISTWTKAMQAFTASFETRLMTPLQGVSMLRPYTSSQRVGITQGQQVCRLMSALELSQSFLCRSCMCHFMLPTG